MLSLGLMSGTSMDGIDAALLETDGSEKLIKARGQSALSYDPAFKILLKTAEYAVRKAEGDLAQAKASYQQALRAYLSQELGLRGKEVEAKENELAAYLQGSAQKKTAVHLEDIILHSTQLHVLAVKKLLEKTGYSASQIDLIGYHGQTLFHRPEKKISLIVGDGQYLANQLSITVINNFRQCDIQAGGQGAPFAPLYHYALALRDKTLPLAVVNCGGIANLTLITSVHERDLLAYDTGPGNGLIDRLVRQRSQGKESMDENGHYGKKGKVHERVLSALYEKALIKEGQNYFSLPPPKALDLGNLRLIPELDPLSLEDACATLEAFTADTMLHHLKHLNRILPEHWILAGGGWNNPVILQELEKRLTRLLGKKAILQTADQAGWNSQALEAQIFAYLAVRSLQNKPLSLPGTTGVPQPLSGGEAYLPPGGATEKVQKYLKENPRLLTSL